MLNSVNNIECILKFVGIKSLNNDGILCSSTFCITAIIAAALIDVNEYSDDKIYFACNKLTWAKPFIYNAYWLKVVITPTPLEKGVALHLNKFSSPLPKVVLCKVWLKLAQPVLERLIDSVFRSIGNKTLSNQSIFPQEPLGQEDFYMLAVDFHYHFALWKDVALHLNKLEFSSPNNTLCQVWLRLAQLF